MPLNENPGLLNLRISTRSIKRSLLSSYYRPSLIMAYQVMRSIVTDLQYNSIFGRPDLTQEEIFRKLKKLRGLGKYHITNRVPLFREIARLEQRIGNELMASVYKLRIMRLLGTDLFGDLPHVSASLEKFGFQNEARVADALYGNHPDQEARCTHLLRDAYQNNKAGQDWEFEYLDDRRPNPSYKVSIIVSLYKAASKLPVLLKTICPQRMIKTGQAEIILIDSGSPDRENNVFNELFQSLAPHIVYARSTHRETIQSAWNRGISLSRSPYLAFLGVDENLVPDALDILADELDQNPQVDWVIGDSLITDVDKNGTFLSKGWLYNRKGFDKEKVYLETGYLSWVGALYRKSIHTRFGYYDPTFSAAGDTEFKNRILPFIQIKHVPKLLGVFLNYPESRTTESPKAEIEDLRAWHIHRTLAGIKYAFRKLGPAKTEELFYKSLCYRKSYLKHRSTDIEYAHNILAFLQEAVPNSPALGYRNEIKQLLEAYRALDFIQAHNRFATSSALFRTIKAASRTEQHCNRLSNRMKTFPCRIFNDNRYEQYMTLF